MKKQKKIRSSKKKSGLKSNGFKIVDAISGCLKIHLNLSD